MLNQQLGAISEVLKTAYRRGKARALENHMVQGYAIDRPLQSLSTLSMGEAMSAEPKGRAKDSAKARTSPPSNLLGLLASRASWGFGALRGES